MGYLKSQPILHIIIEAVAELNDNPFNNTTDCKPMSEFPPFTFDCLISSNNFFFMLGSQ